MSKMDLPSMNNMHPHTPTTQERIIRIKALLKDAERSYNYAAADDYRAQLRALEGKK